MRQTLYSEKYVPQLTPAPEGEVGKGGENGGRASLGVMIGGSDEDMREDAEEGETQVLPPDGGWGWVVVAASFLCNVMVDGIIFTTGIMLPQIQEEFQVSNFQVTWVGSLLGGFYLLAGPFVSSMANAYGFRVVGILGAFIAALASGASYFAPTIGFLYVCYGIIGGIGFGFIYVPAVIATGFYFERRRALATGIAVCGSGIGTFVMAPMTRAVLATSWGWRGCVLAKGGLILTCAVFSLAFRRLSAATGRVVPVDAGQQAPLMLRIKAARDADFKACLSDVSLQAPMEKPALRHPSIARIASEACTVSRHLDASKTENGVSANLLHPQSAVRGPQYARNGSAPSLALARGRQSVDSTISRRRSRVSFSTETNRPFYRDDIFYSGSMARLPQYTSSDSVGHYHASVTHIPAEVVEEIIKETEDDEGCCSVIPIPARAVLNKMFDFSLFSSPTFVVLACSGFLALFCLFVPFNLLPMFVKDEMGLEQEEAEQTTAFLMALIGVCNTIGRVVCGYVSDHPKVDAILVNNVALVIGGIATALVPFINSFPSMNSVALLYAYGVIFGFSIAVFAALRSILCVELLGLEKLTNAFGLLLLIQGIAAIIGTPVAGKFADATGDFSVSFYVFGAIFAFAGLMCAKIRSLKKWEDERNEKKANPQCVL